MRRIEILLFYLMLAIVTYGQTESDATAIAKLNLELSHVEMKADSIQIDGIFNMLVSEKQKLEEAENTLSNLVKGSRDYIKQKEDVKIYRRVHLQKWH